MIRTSTLSGPDIRPIVPELARLRTVVFRDYPYLYDGDAAYEEWYLADFASAPGAVVIAAHDGETLVGAATASPMRSQKPEFSQPLAELGIAVDALFYCGESVLLPDYRGHGLGHAFFDGRQAAARAQGFALIGFYAVIRPEDHPLKPQGYSPLHGFWGRRGYAPLPGAIASFPWKEVGQGAESDHPMQFWIRRLAGD